MKISKAIYDIQLRWANRVVTLAKQNLQRGKKIATGTLYNSMSFSITPKGKVTFQYAEEGKWVQRGRRAFPNRGVNPEGEFVKSIAKWATTKGLPQFRDKKGRYISNNSRAYLIATSINRKGIKPFPFYTEAVIQATKQLSPKKSIKEAIKASLRKAALGR